MYPASADCPQIRYPRLVELTTASLATELPSGTITLLLTDIEGSTSLWERHHDAMREAVARHDAILERIVAGHHGVDLRKKGEGDSHFAVFQRASDAVAASLAIHRALAAEDWPEIEQLKVRVALHCGEAQLRGDDYYGPTVNRCARLRGVGYGCQTLLSEACMRLASGSIPEGASLKSLGQHRLKDLLEPEHIYQLNAEGLPDKFPPLKSLSVAKHNLPVQLTSFVGRSAQIAKIKSLVYSSHLVTLLGAGGSGKTRLALQVGADTLDEFPDGVWFATLIGVEDSLVPQTVAEALPISLKNRDPLQAIVEEFSQSRALLVIDNCELVARSVGSFLNKVLRQCPEMVVLATSREPLAVAGESLFQVPPMDCDLKGREANLEHASALEAVQLFRERASKRLSGEEILTESTAKDVAALCKKLDGIPLALEQAASNLFYMSAREILDRLEQHFALLELDEEGIDERHRTMQATIDWSFRMLSEAEQRLFMSLSIFTGGWTLKAAESVCAEDVIPANRVVQTLEKLVRRSMVVYDRSTSRYRMLEPIREYASSIRPAEQDERLRERHFDWFFHLAKQASEGGLDRDSGHRLEQLTQEHDNIRAALHWSLARPPQGCRALELSISMHRYWYRLGLCREGAIWMQRSMEACPGLPEELKAEALNVLGVLVWQQGDLDSAQRAFEASLETWNALHNEVKASAALSNLAGLAFMREDYETAAKLFMGCAAIFEAHGETTRWAHALENAGVSLSKEGCLDEAVCQLTRAVELHRTTQSPASVAKALDSLFGVYAMQGGLLDRLPLFIEAGNIALGIGDTFAIESLLEGALQVCEAINEEYLAAQCLGAIERVGEQTSRWMTPGPQRERIRTNVQTKLGGQVFKRAIREGRTLAAAAMLGFVVQKVEERIEQQPGNIAVASLDETQ